MSEPYFLRVEDFGRAVIGPFATPQEAMQQFEMQKARGDGADFISIDRTPPCDSDDLSLTPEEDAQA